MKLTSPENDINASFQERLGNDYTDQTAIIKSAYEYCFPYDKSPDSDSRDSWTKSAEQRMKEMAHNFSINFEDYQTTPGAHEIPIVVAMTFKTFLCLDSAKGKAGSYLKNGQFEKISHEDKNWIIDTTMDFLCEQYKNVPDAKDQIEEGRNILLNYEKYEQDKEATYGKIVERIKDFMSNELEEYFNQVKNKVGEYVDEDDHTGIWATIPKTHPEALSIEAKKILLNRFDYYISQAIEKWKYVVSIYAESCYINEVEKDADTEEKNNTVLESIKEAEKKVF